MSAVCRDVFWLVIPVELRQPRAKSLAAVCGTRQPGAQLRHPTCRDAIDVKAVRHLFVEWRTAL